MTLSMTGFARAPGQSGDDSWTWEVKSVNARGLDIRMRLPSGHDDVEQAIRALIGKRFQRGSVNVSLTLKQGAAAHALQVNRALLSHLISVAREEGVAEPNIEALMAVRGVVEPVDVEADAATETERRSYLVQSFETALDDLADSRKAEGQRLHTVLEDRLAEIESLVGQAEAAARARQESAQERLTAQVDALLQATQAVPEDRLAQELALLAVKSDVQEEIDRLRAHIGQARELLAEPGAIGRRFDFLCQEFNREANTLCSKSGDTAMTRAGLELKTVIDQLREQVQNVE